MKKHYLLLIILPGMMCILASCNTKPKPPDAANLSVNDIPAQNYAKAENEYTGKWLDQFSSLRKTVSDELISSVYTIPAEQSVRNDTMVKVCGIWKIFVKNGKEVHALSTENGKAVDRVIFTENDPEFMVSLCTSSSKKYFFIESISAQSSELRFLPVSSKSLNPALVRKREPGVLYTVDHFGGNLFWILSNEHAPNRCILIAPAEAQYPANWKAAVRENDSVFIENYTVIGGQYMILVQRKHLSTSLEITSIYQEKKQESSIENKINFPEPEGRISDLFYDQNEDKLVFRYSSIITPPTCYTYSIHSMYLGIRWKTQIKNFVRDDYKAEVIWAPGKDKSRIPVSLIRKRDLVRPDGANPLILFIEPGTPCEPLNSFRSDILSLLDRGFSVAFVHVPDNIPADREGGDMITAAVSALIRGKYTAQGLISLAGKSCEARIACKAAIENPSWYRALVMDSPGLPDRAGNLNMPFIYLYADPAGNDQGFQSLRLASAIRKITKPGNTLLVSMSNQGIRQPGMSAGLITFLLVSYGIGK